MNLRTINQIQDDIIVSFQMLAGDRESMLTYMMELGNKRPSLHEQYKTDEYAIPGCLSKVWLAHQQKDGILTFQADSNTAITKGLISLLVQVLSRQRAIDIIDAQLYFIEEIGMNQLIGFQRANGFSQMLKQIKLLALPYAETTPNSR